MSNDFGRAAAKLRNLGPAIVGVLPGAVRAGALVVKAEVESRAPSDDGELKASIGDRPVESNATSASHQTHVGIFYAYYVEHGHAGPHGSPRRTPAHPFFRPAADAKAEEATATTMRIILEASRKATG